MLKARKQEVIGNPSVLCAFCDVTVTESCSWLESSIAAVVGDPSYSER